MKRREKRIHSLALALCSALLALVLLPTAGLAASGTFAVVNNPNPIDRLNLREWPNISSKSLGKYYNGVEVRILEYTSADWWKVQIGQTIGYMQNSFLLLSPPVGAVASAKPTMEVNNPNPIDRLNLRASPSSNAASLAKYNNGTQVTVLGVLDDWVHVDVGGLTGYMMTKYLKSPDGGNPLQPTRPPTQVGPTAPPTQGVSYAVVNNPNSQDRLNLRQSASINGVSLGKYYNGVMVELTGWADGTWVSVRIGNAYGYMQQRYLSPLPATNVSSIMPVRVVSNPISTDRLNLRAGPSMTTASLGKYGNGTLVVVWGVVGDQWVHVDVGGRSGYMMTKYLR